MANAGAAIAAGISAGAALTSTVGGIVGDAKSADAARCVTAKIDNKTGKLLHRPKHRADHGGIYYDFTSIPPFGTGTVRFESGGLMTGAEGIFELTVSDVSAIQAKDVDGLPTDEDVKDALRGLFKLKPANTVLYFPSEPKAQGSLCIYANTPYAGKNDFGCKLLALEDGLDLGGLQKPATRKGPTGTQDQEHWFWDDALLTKLEWNASEGNKANMNITLEVKLAPGAGA